MKDNYDFSSAVKNPYYKKLTEEITLNLDKEVIQYFQAEAKGKGIPLERLLQLYLKECMVQQRKLNLSWD